MQESAVTRSPQFSNLPERVAHIALASRDIHRFAFRHRVERYHPGAVIYNLSEYPAPGQLAPTAYDHELLATLAQNGVELIELHEEWNDALRILGGDKFTSYDPQGLRAFIGAAHEVGLQVIGYMSSGFFQRDDIDFDERWIRYTDSLAQIYFDYAVCSPASHEWRSYLLPRLVAMLDDYGFDGLYNDVGYDWLLHHAYARAGDTPVETIDNNFELPYDPALEDLLGEIADLVHRRGGVNKIHMSWDLAPNTIDKVYDYLWVGELVDDFGQLRQTTRNYAPYVVPCPDFSRTSISETDVYLHTIPYLQFPLRVDGRPVTGERVFANVRYREPIEQDHWHTHFRAIHDYYSTHPEGPYSYGAWDSAVPRIGARDLWLEYLRLYKPMVTTGALCWIDVRSSDLVRPDPLPEDMVLSVFISDRFYVVVANYGDQTVELTANNRWRDRILGSDDRRWKISPRSLRFFELILDDDDRRPQPSLDG